MDKRSLRGMGSEVKALCSYALSQGWAVEQTRNLHLKFTKAGRRTVFFSGTPGDHRAWLNGKAKLRRADAEEVCHG